MSIGFVLALGAVFVASCMNVVSKFVSHKYEIEDGLMMQYFFVTLIGLTVIFVADIDIRNLSIPQRWYMITLGCIWYVDYRCFYKALKQLHTGTVLIISSLTIFVSYAINSILFPDMIFSWLKTVVALCFIVLVIVYIVSSRHHNKHWDISHILHNVINHNQQSHEGIGIHTQLNFKIDRAYIWAIISTFMASLLYVWLWYGLKTNFITPLQATIIPDMCTFLIAVWVYGEHHDFSYAKSKAWVLKYIIPYMVIGILSITNSVMIYMAIRYSDPNNVSIIRLTGILLAPILAQVFLKDMLTRLQWYLTIVWVVLIVLFIALS